jgi:hypothetical protein
MEDLQELRILFNLEAPEAAFVAAAVEEADAPEAEAASVAAAAEETDAPEAEAASVAAAAEKTITPEAAGADMEDLEAHEAAGVAAALEETDAPEAAGVAAAVEETDATEAAGVAAAVEETDAPEVAGVAAAAEVIAPGAKAAGAAMEAASSIHPASTDENFEPESDESDEDFEPESDESSDSSDDDKPQKYKKCNKKFCLGLQRRMKCSSQENDCLRVVLDKERRRSRQEEERLRDTIENLERDLQQSHNENWRLKSIVKGQRGLINSMQEKYGGGGKKRQHDDDE